MEYMKFWPKISFPDAYRYVSFTSTFFDNESSAQNYTLEI